MRTLGLAFLLASSLLSGCIAADAGEGTDPISVITDPRDIPLNGTGAHVHDYWGGKAFVDLVDGTVSSTWNNLGGGRWRRTFVPPDEVVVPQGTASINVTVDWRDGSLADSYGAVSLWVKPANTVEPRFVSELASGDRVEVPVAYEEADLPHQLLSAWEFIVQYNSSTTYNAFLGTTHLNATAHRGLPLQPFPAHPDLWQGRDEMPLVDVTQQVQHVGYTGSGTIPVPIRALDGALVPPDADHVTVAIQLQAGSAAPAAGWLQVLFHGADTRSWTSLGVVSFADGEATWDVSVEDGMGDGPYNNASLWQFRVVTPAWGPSNPGTTTSPAAFAGSFHLTATVHKD